jgi:hypothetical protein
MSRLTFILCLALAGVGCARKEQPSAGKDAHGIGASSAGAGSMYATEAQHARAHYYWLPQNQLPPDAGIASGGG